MSPRPDSNRKKKDRFDPMVEKEMKESPEYKKYLQEHKRRLRRLEREVKGDYWDEPEDC